MRLFPAVPEEKLGKYAAVIVFATVAGAIVEQRVTTDQKRTQRPTRAMPEGSSDLRARMDVRPEVGVHRVETAQEAEQLADQLRARGVEVQTMTPEEYAAQFGANGHEYPTVAATDDSLIDRIASATMGVDQGTLAEHARASGRLEGN